MKSFSSFFSGGLLVLFLVAFGLPAAAQAPAWQSARAVAAATVAISGINSVVTATAVDAAGNVYLAGTFRYSVVVGSIALTTPFGATNVFIAKFNPASNQFVWAQRAGGTNQCFATALAVSGTSVYVTGYFGGATASFGSTILTNTGLTNTGSYSYDIFVAKLTDAGSTSSFVWAQRAGGTDNDQANALTVSGTSIYVAGEFASPTVGFGTIMLANMDPSRNRDVFVTKLTDAGSTGSFMWAQRAGSVGLNKATALAVSGTSVYVTGYFAGPTADFGPAVLTNTGSYSYDIFVAKLTDAGSTGGFVWAQRAGSTSYDIAYALAANGTSVYVAGNFGGPTAAFGTTTLINTGAYDAFVAKLTDAGNTGSFAWAQRAGSAGNEEARALAVSGTSVYVAGYFDGATADFGAAILTNSGPGISDVFVAKLTDASSTGSFVWAQRAGGTRTDRAFALAVSGTSVYVAGQFNSTAAGFSSVTLVIPYYDPDPNAGVGFLASLTDPTLTATTAGRPLPPTYLFPNPAHHTATLRLPAGTTPTPFTLTDALGRAVRRYPAPASSEAALDLRGLPAGLYLLRGAGPAQRLAVE